MKGFVEVGASILPSSSCITINAELKTREDVAAFVAVFNPTVEAVFPDPDDAQAEEEGQAQTEGDDA